MKRSTAFIMFIFVLLIFASCSIRINLPSGQTKAPNISAPLYSPPSVLTDSPGLYTPPAVYTGPPILSPMPFSGPAVIAAHGDVIGGYADGHWLSHSEAAAYCTGPLTFNLYNLTGLVSSAESSGVTANDDADFVNSRTIYMAEGERDENGSYTLGLPEIAYGNYSSDPLSCAYLNTVPPERIPAISTSDTSPYLPAVQQLIDDNMGAGAAVAQIKVAVVTDIDGDGQQETVINADNCADIMDSPSGNIYSIVLLIESDGRALPVREFYAVDDGSEYPDAELIYAANIIDIDGDGMYELILYRIGFEARWTEVFDYDGYSISQVITYGTGT